MEEWKKPDYEIQVKIFPGTKIFNPGNRLYDSSGRISTRFPHMIPGDIVAVYSQYGWIRARVELLSVKKILVSLRDGNLINIKYPNEIATFEGNVMTLR
jgi:hypothetical protein